MNPKRISVRNLARLWHRAPRRWGHQLHSLCSYMAMFPPTIPHVFIRWLTKAGDVVFDPFSGRGTTALEACLLGRVGYGTDANPLAWVLTCAKVDPPEKRSIQRRLADLRSSIRVHDPSNQPGHIKMLFAPRTLGQLLWLRANLDPCKKIDRFLVATLLGILHANANSDGKPRGLTVSMPNTFSMSPGYVAKYIKEHRLRPPKVEILDHLEERLRCMPLPSDSFRPGRAWLQDVTRSIQWPKHGERAKLIFTSPPYLEVIRYGKFNWIRLWFLGVNPAKVDEKLFSSSSVTNYLEFMRKALCSMRDVLRQDGYICVVIGDVRRGEKYINLASTVARECVPRTDLRVVGIVSDSIPVQHKVSRIWKDNRGRATKTDRILILAGPKAADPSIYPAIQWTGCS